MHAVQIILQVPSAQFSFNLADRANDATFLTVNFIPVCNAIVIIIINVD